MITEVTVPRREQALTSLCERSLVPPGLQSSFPLYPALKRWANLARPPPGLDTRTDGSTGFPKASSHAQAEALLHSKAESPPASYLAVQTGYHPKKDAGHWFAVPASGSLQFLDRRPYAW